MLIRRCIRIILYILTPSVLTTLRERGETVHDHVKQTRQHWIGNSWHRHLHVYMADGTSRALELFRGFFLTYSDHPPTPFQCQSGPVWGFGGCESVTIRTREKSQRISNCTGCVAVRDSDPVQPGLVVFALLCISSPEIRPPVRPHPPPAYLLLYALYNPRPCNRSSTVALQHDTTPGCGNSYK